MSEDRSDQRPPACAIHLGCGRQSLLAHHDAPWCSASTRGTYQSPVLAPSIQVSIADCLKYTPLKENICLNAAVCWEVALIPSQREKKVTGEFLRRPDSRILPSFQLFCKGELTPMLEHFRREICRGARSTATSDPWWLQAFN